MRLAVRPMDNQCVNSSGLCLIHMYILTRILRAERQLLIYVAYRQRSDGSVKAERWELGHEETVKMSNVYQQSAVASLLYYDFR